MYLINPQSERRIKVYYHNSYKEEEIIDVMLLEISLYFYLLFWTFIILCITVILCVIYNIQ